MFYTYGDEGFFFSRPALLKGLFSWRKGWLLYTPMMALALTGFVFLKKRIPQAFWPLLIFTFANIWIITSWWSWWYGGSLGMRPMIDSYALLALPLAAFISGLLEKKKKREDCWTGTHLFAEFSFRIPNLSVLLRGNSLGFHESESLLQQFRPSSSSGWLQGNARPT